VRLSCRSTLIHQPIPTVVEHWLTLANFPRTLPAMPDGIKLSEFIAWRQKTSPATKKGQAQKR